MIMAARAGVTGTASRVFSCLFLVAAADILLYADEVGWTLGYFGLLVLAFAVVHNPALIANRSGQVLAFACATLGLALIESVNLLAFTLFCVALAALIGGAQASDLPSVWLRKTGKAVWNVIGWAVVEDAMTLNRYQKRTATIGVLPGLVQGWLLPLVLSAVFLLLFASANPIVEHWLRGFDPSVIERLLTPLRMMFWFMIAVASWGTLRSARIRVASPGVRDKGPSAIAAFLFSRRAVARSLALFNVLFLAQNLMDAGYLWAGVALPDGLTYAEYAHRGAYPLVLTALLAAAFVLIALRRGSALNEDGAIRSLIYLWLLQNMVLVISSIWRTDLYISEYSLTYLRLAALIWMGLVFAGLVFIVVKIVYGKSSHWLVGVNLAAAFAVLYAACFADMGRFIAEYNVDHCREVRGTGDSLDTGYLMRIGPSALPALYRLQSTLKADAKPVPFKVDTIRPLAVLLQRSVGNWRSWTFRDYRLARELASAMRE